MSSKSHTNSTTDPHVKRLQRVREINRAFREINHIPKKMLDVGFGNAAIANHYYTQGFEVAGIEVTKSFVENAKRNYPGPDFRLYDGLTFPFNDNTFDTILMNDILEHISYSSIEQVMSEAKRVLTNDGILYISVMNRWQVIEPHKLIPFLTWLPRITWHPICKRIKDEDYVFYWPYSRGRLEKLLNKLDLRYKDVTYIYVQHKFYGANPIGSKTTASIVRLVKKLGLLSILYYLALKVSVLVYIIAKHEF
jgi:SAM-dependent methyltransferase